MTNPANTYDVEASVGFQTIQIELPKVPLGDDPDAAAEIANYVLEHTRQFSNDFRTFLNERYYEAPVSAEHGFELDTAINSMIPGWLFSWPQQAKK